MSKKVITVIVFTICGLLMVGTMVNVLSDNEAVIKLAEQTVCAPGDASACKYAKTSMMRTAIGQTFTFTGEGKTLDVVCRRSLIVFGSYSCKIDGSH